MAKDKNYMPQGSAGLIRYFDDTKELIKLKPEHVVIGTIVLIGLEMALNILL